MYNIAIFTLYAFVFVFGICIASFLNVVIYHAPNKISIAKGRSFCPKCNTQIKEIDLFPIISFLFLKGKCRSCKGEIPIRYPLVELLGGLIALLCVIKFEYTVYALLAFAFCAVLICISFIDIDTQTIPNSLIISLIPIVIAFAFLPSSITIWERVIGFFAISVPLLIMTFIIPDCFGGGDIKLLAVAGFGLGYKNIILAFIVALIVTGVFLCVQVIKKKYNKKAHIAFGQFLAVGIATALLYGDSIIEWYLALCGF